MESIKNYLDKDLFNNLKNILFSQHFPWYFKEHMTNTNTNKDNYFFFHFFYHSYASSSPLFAEYIIPILKKLNVISLIEARANLLLKDKTIYQSNFHTDKKFKCNTAILYINTCNGYTVLDENEKIKISCDENKMLIFNSQIKHAAVSQTDVDRRIVINLNYF